LAVENGSADYSSTTGAPHEYFGQAGTAADFVTLISNLNDSTPDHALKVISMCWPGSLTFGEIMDSLNRFYAAPENGPLSLSGVIQLVADRAAGSDSAAIEERTSKCGPWLLVQVPRREVESNIKFEIIEWNALRWGDFVHFIPMDWDSALGRRSVRWELAAQS
jgi:hypothetical protein